MSKPKREWLGHNCAQCKTTPGGKAPKLARMQCQAWIGGDNGRQCGRFICNEHGHQVGNMTVCNRCQPVSPESRIAAPNVEQAALFS